MPFTYTWPAPAELDHVVQNFLERRLERGAVPLTLLLGVAPVLLALGLSIAPVLLALLGDAVEQATGFVSMSAQNAENAVIAPLDCAHPRFHGIAPFVQAVHASGGDLVAGDRAFRQPLDPLEACINVLTLRRQGSAHAASKKQCR